MVPLRTNGLLDGTAGGIDGTTGVITGRAPIIGRLSARPRMSGDTASVGPGPGDLRREAAIGTAGSGPGGQPVARCAVTDSPTITQADRETQSTAVSARATGAVTA